MNTLSWQFFGANPDVTDVVCNAFVINRTFTDINRLEKIIETPVYIMQYRPNTAAPKRIIRLN